MLQALPMYGALCPRCGGSTVYPPSSYDRDSWVTCTGCERPTLSWDDYKQRALLKAQKDVRRIAVERNLAGR